MSTLQCVWPVVLVLIVLCYSLSYPPTYLLTYLPTYATCHCKYSIAYPLPQSVNLKASAVELLEAMLEETSDKTKELVLEIHGGLDMPAMYDTLVDFHELMRDPEVIAESFDDEAERGLFRTYHVLVHFADYPGLKLDTIGQWWVWLSMVCPLKLSSTHEYQFTSGLQSVLFITFSELLFSTCDSFQCLFAQPLPLSSCSPWQGSRCRRPGSLGVLQASLQEH